MTCLFTHQGRRQREENACIFWPWPETWRGCQPIRCALAARVMSYEVDIRGKGATEWEVCDLHRSPSIISPLPASLTLFCKAWSGKEKKKKKRVRAFCVNSLIRKTLTSIVPLHFGGKIFHWFFFAAIEGGQSWEGLCVGLHSAGGFQGRVGRRRGVSVCASVRRWMVR